MTDADSKKLEEIAAARAIKYNFTAENWAGKQVRDDLEDIDYLISKLTEQDQEIKRLNGQVNIYIDIEMALTDRADKAETATRRLQERVRELGKKCREWQAKDQYLYQARKKLEAELAAANKSLDIMNDLVGRLQSQVRELEEKLQTARSGHANALPDSIMTGEHREGK